VKTPKNQKKDTDNLMIVGVFLLFAGLFQVIIYMMAPSLDKRHIFLTPPFRGGQVSCIMDADSRAAKRVCGSTSMREGLKWK
jgi:hypothetical protein